jgi:hypothetical protein
MADLAADVKTKIMPTVVEGKTLISVLRPRVEIIIKNMNFQMTETVPVRIGNIKVLELSKTYDFYAQDSDGKLLKSFESSGVVNVKYVGTKQEPLMGIGAPVPVYYFESGLTDSGKRYQVGSVRRNPTNNFEYADMKACARELGEVTGIAFSGDNKEAQVDFTWKFDDLTPFAAAPGAGGIENVCRNSTPQKQSVAMRLYDDGWRLVE